MFTRSSSYPFSPCIWCQDIRVTIWTGKDKILLNKSDRLVLHSLVGRVHSKIWHYFFFNKTIYMLVSKLLQRQCHIGVSPLHTCTFVNLTVICQMGTLLDLLKLVFTNALICHGRVDIMTPLLVKMIVVVESNNQTKIMFQHSILNRILLYQKYIRFEKSVHT